MLTISGNEKVECPYTDWLKIDTKRGCISWYELLGVPHGSSEQRLQQSWRKRRADILRRRNSNNLQICTQVLDELDRAYVCLITPSKREAYDREFIRRESQISLLDGWSSRSRFPPATVPLPKSAERPPEKKQPRAVKSAGAAHKPCRRYEPLGLLGRGSGGTTVMEVYEYKLKRRLALKRLDPTARTASRRKAFSDEACRLAGWIHPHVAEVYAVNRNACRYTMELLPLSLKERFATGRRGECSETEALMILQAGLSALQSLHSSGRLHGAIRLESFRVSESDTVKLTDAPGCTDSGIFRAPVSNQRCIAPELLTPETFGTPGPASDLYMLGFVVLELLAGDRLSEWFTTCGRHDHQQILRWHSSPYEELPSMEELIPEIGDQLRDILDRLCRKLVSERYSTATEALEAIGTLARETRVPAAPELSEEPDWEKAAAIAKGSELSPTADDSPLLRRAPAAKQPDQDLLTLIQDPAQLISRMTADRRTKLISTAVAACLVLAMMWPSSAQTPVSTHEETLLSSDETREDMDGRPPNSAVPETEDDTADSLSTVTQSAPIELQPLPTAAIADLQPLAR